jgi:hypothetical protein
LPVIEEDYDDVFWHFNKAFSISIADPIAVLTGFVMLCQVFSASWSATIGRNNHFDHKQDRDLRSLADLLPIPVIRLAHIKT